jgi:hypothetical protein
LHTNPHLPLLHEGDALATLVVHVVPHIPQFVALVLVLTQLPPHIIVPEGQAHTELWHVCPPAHACDDPQPPQLLLSIASLASASSGVEPPASSGGVLASPAATAGVVALPLRAVSTDLLRPWTGHTEAH